MYVWRRLTCTPAPHSRLPPPCAASPLDGSKQARQRWRWPGPRDDAEARDELPLWLVFEGEPPPPVTSARASVAPAAYVATSDVGIEPTRIQAHADATLAGSGSGVDAASSGAPDPYAETIHTPEVVHDDWDVKALDPRRFPYHRQLHAAAADADVAGCQAVLDEMAAAGLTPGPPAIHAFVFACIKAGTVSVGYQVAQEAYMHGMPLLDETYLALIWGLVEAGQMTEAEDLLLAMIDGENNPLRGWLTLTKACFRCSRTKEAFDHLSRGLADGWEPDAELFELAIAAYCEQGVLEEAFRMLASMLDLGVLPYARHFNLLVEGTAREGGFGMGLEVIESMVNAMENDETLPRPNEDTFNAVIRGTVAGAVAEAALEGTSPGAGAPSEDPDKDEVEEWREGHYHSDDFEGDEEVTDADVNPVRPRYPVRLLPGGILEPAEADGSPLRSKQELAPSLFGLPMGFGGEEGSEEEEDDDEAEDDEDAESDAEDGEEGEEDEEEDEGDGDWDVATAVYAVRREMIRCGVATGPEHLALCVQALLQADEFAQAHAELANLQKAKRLASGKSWADYLPDDVIAELADGLASQERPMDLVILMTAVARTGRTLTAGLFDLHTPQTLNAAGGSWQPCTCLTAWFLPRAAQAQQSPVQDGIAAEVMATSAHVDGTIRELSTDDANTPVVLLGIANCAVDADGMPIVANKMKRVQLAAELVARGREELDGNVRDLRAEVVLQRRILEGVISKWTDSRTLRQGQAYVEQFRRGVGAGGDREAVLNDIRTRMQADQARQATLAAATKPRRRGAPDEDEVPDSAPEGDAVEAAATAQPPGSSEGDVATGGPGEPPREAGSEVGHGGSARVEDTGEDEEDEFGYSMSERWTVVEEDLSGVTRNEEVPYRELDKGMRQAARMAQEYELGRSYKAPTYNLDNVNFEDARDMYDMDALEDSAYGDARGDGGGDGLTGDDADATALSVDDGQVDSDLDEDDGGGDDEDAPRRGGARRRGDDGDDEGTELEEEEDEGEDWQDDEVEEGEEEGQARRKGGMRRGRAKAAVGEGEGGELLGNEDDEEADEDEEEGDGWTEALEEYNDDIDGEEPAAGSAIDRYNAKGQFELAKHTDVTAGLTVLMECLRLGRELRMTVLLGDFDVVLGVAEQERDVEALVQLHRMAVEQYREAMLAEEAGDDAAAEVPEGGEHAVETVTQALARVSTRVDRWLQQEGNSALASKLRQMVPEDVLGVPASADVGSTNGATLSPDSQNVAECAVAAATGGQPDEGREDENDGNNDTSHGHPGNFL